MWCGWPLLIVLLWGLPTDAQSAIETAGPPSTSEMVSVPAGEFWMGCREETDLACFANEKPGRLVSLPAYRIDTYEVTVAEYQRCAEAEICTRPATHSVFCNWEKEDRSQHPINCVSWQQAQTYCQWAGKRLPTEAEWEKAARGTDGRIYPWGNGWDKSNARVANSGTLAVGSHPAGVSPYGVHDMIGNVREWVADWYDAQAYQANAAQHPSSPQLGEEKVLRSSSWLDIQWFSRVSYRGRNFLNYQSDGAGFRCAMDVLSSE